MSADTAVARETGHSAAAAVKIVSLHGVATTQRTPEPPPGAANVAQTRTDNRNRPGIRSLLIIMGVSSNMLPSIRRKMCRISAKFIWFV